MFRSQNDFDSSDDRGWFESATAPLSIDRVDRTGLFDARMKPVSQQNGTDEKLGLVLTSHDDRRGKIGVNPTLSRNCNVFEMSKILIQSGLDLELT